MLLIGTIVVILYQRRGRLHKRQLEEADGTNGNEEGRGKKLRTDEDSAAELEAFNETDYYIENGLLLYVCTCHHI